MKRLLILMTLLLAGCTTYPSTNVRLDLGCRFERHNGQPDERVEHAHCYNHNHTRELIHFEYHF